MTDKAQNGAALKKLLPHGAQGEIARRLGLKKAAVSMALSTLKPSHPAVKEAVRIIKDSGSAETQRELLALLQVAETPKAA